jgi:hypothetical protein
MTPLDEIERLAQQATPGPWKKVEHGGGDVRVDLGIEQYDTGILCRADAAFIAACSPDVVLKLIAVARAAMALEADNSDDPELICGIFEAVRAMRSAT